MNTTYATLGVVASVKSLVGVNIAVLVDVNDIWTKGDAKVADGRFVAKEYS